MRELTVALDATTARVPGFALVVVDSRTGGRYTYRAADHFETASIVKVDIVASLLLRAQDEQRALTATERSLSDAMIRRSDNVAAVTLYDRIGGPAGLNAANRRFGLHHTVAEPLCGLTRTTAGDQARLLRTVFDPAGPLAAASRSYLGALMGSVVPGQRWGISAAATGGEATVLKNGWLARDTDDGRHLVHSIGRITGAGTDVVMVVLSRGHRDLSEGVEVVESAARLARRYLRW